MIVRPFSIDDRERFGGLPVFVSAIVTYTTVSR